MASQRPNTDAGTQSETLDWIRTPADERAAAGGMRFDPERAAFVCNWIEGYCRLYEGATAGQPFVLLSFQRDFLSRLFGWVRWSDEWGEWIRRFTHAGFWAAKKNGKSPIAAAYNLYLLAGEGEAGQKVYMMAKDGAQARIAQKHAMMMVMQSPDLDIQQGGDCKVNRTTLEITHLPTQSVIQIVTGDDSRRADAKHGYNGSVTIDEMHVVDRAKMEAVGRAGISRKEPLQTSFSTAGTDPSSVGHERCQYGRQVNSGERIDPHFLHVEYSVPDEVTETEIDANLEKYAEMANPAWGSIVKPSELRADWQRSKGSQRLVSIFLQERLNRWVSSASRWLDGKAWEQSGREFDLTDLAGRDCYLALDLSRRFDMSSAVFAFPWPESGLEHVRIWPMFWLPQQTAEERNHLFPFLSWAASGHLMLTPGGTVDYGDIKAVLRSTIREHRFNVMNLYYDVHYANELTQSLHEGERIGDQIEQSVVAERTEVRQGIMGLTKLACEFERRVRGGMIIHPRNSVLTWQVGHCEVVRDRNQNIAPVKPETHSGKSIDGVVSSVMTMAGCTAIVEDGTISANLYTVGV